jgi:predicted MPP superfamily phosphohydrolase
MEAAMNDIKSKFIGVVGDHANVSGGQHYHEHHHYDTSNAAGDTALADDPTSIETESPTPDRSDAGLIHILHLSDLHCGVADAQRWAGQLADDLKQELNCHRIQAMIISGDVADIATKEEYAATKNFIEEIRKEFQIDRSHLVIVPGNHDLNWKLSKKGYTLKDKEELEAHPKEGEYIPVSDEVIRLKDEMAYMQRFLPFSDFYQEITGTDYPLEYAEQGIIYHLKDAALLILGLNSAWGVDHHYKDRAGICDAALDRALTTLRQNDAYANCLKMAVWHHPIHSAAEDRITDHGFMERLALNGFCACLHGHLHQSTNDFFRYDHRPGGRKIEIVGAGTFGAPAKAWTPGYPLQYNLLKVYPKRIVVETRRREEINGAWKADARWSQGPGKDPLPRYTIDLMQGFKKKKACRKENGHTTARRTRTWP